MVQAQTPLAATRWSMAWLLVAVLLSLLIPFAALVVGPALIVHGAYVLRRVGDPAQRALAWAELAAGLLMIGLIVFSILGLMAVDVGSAVTEGPVVVDGP